jgi:hypothetical protein
MTADTLKRAWESVPRLEALRLELQDFLVVAKQSIDDENLSCLPFP